ncbi:bifunctional pyr operon transcriptional regulator/uracil phosphoribosyltransferase PyrR [Vallitalea okinawensis]|uniref:bifunctional pyr operon transcriptional regulator/uracil phosphoribosyltransferase PyrR n=1 Tax=Vallitalea okinawensis TaxID=2078660 RepID=UPI000CFC92BB|nr:bifunctional pyr operon transcriptional regulator/uracil phosphoribosyltransferase PyrR [Vallitalea okinawensis]
MPSKVILDDKAIQRALTRISHEIIERNKGVEDVVLLGIKTRGVPLAERIVKKIYEVENVNVQYDVIDITFYRDDLKKKSDDPVLNKQLNIDVENKIVVLVDDVIYTGRTARAAIDAVIAAGRPRSIQLAVMVDRGHRELPLRPDFIGKNVPTSDDEVVHVNLSETDDINCVVIEN